MGREYILNEVISNMKRDYDYIIIDCMPSLGMMTINALACADSIIIPTQPSYLAAKGINLLLNTVSKEIKSLFVQEKNCLYELTC